MLKTVRLYNYKSIANEPVHLGNFNVLIGANAAGKSNFVDSLRFIHDILEDGLSSAVGRRFGWENVLNRGKERSERIAAEIAYDTRDMDMKVKLGTKPYEPLKFEYSFEAACSRIKRLYINSEKLENTLESRGTESTEIWERTEHKVHIRNSMIRGGRQQSYSYNVPKQNQEKLFLQASFSTLGSVVLSNIVNGWQFYDLDVSAARQPCIYEGENILLPDGHNLAAILDKLRTSSSRSIRNRVLQLMSILIPSFETWKTERQFDGSLSFKIYEKGMRKAFLPKMVSDGTIRVLCILLALLYQPSRTALICIDEPERYLHPQVFEPLVEIMREVSEKTQLIVTTHSTELVKYLQPNEVFMVDKINNVTHIMRAQDVLMIDKFLEEFTLDELWLAGYLKGGKVL